MLERRAALDGLRAVAIAGVVASHVAVPHLTGGAIGVEVFFVLSGYLITSLLLREHDSTGSLDLVRFSIRRLLRLAPALVLVLVAWAAYALTHHGFALRSETVQGLVPSLLYYANWTRFSDGYGALGWLAPMWSLAVEEQFYLLWPLSLLLLLRSRLRDRIPGVLLSACAAVIAFRVLDLWNLDRTYRRFGTHEIADQLLLGCLLALLIHRASTFEGERLARVCRLATIPALTYLGVVMVTIDETPPLAYHRFFYTVGLTLVGLCAAVLLGRIVLEPHSRPARVLSTRPLPWLGRISYGIYLWHEFVRMVATNGHSPSKPELLLTVSAGAVALAAGSFYLWERPFLRLQARFPTPTASPEAGSSSTRSTDPEGVSEGAAG
jgi:peptidoglycan/LPS O-acetylase OafA/YrhL